jgi:hypothetical protein
MQTLLSSSKSSTSLPVSSERRRSGRWTRCSSITAVLIAASFALVACGLPTAGSTTILNTEKIERAIERSSLAQRGQVAQVSCPSGVHQEKDLKFSCMAAVGPSNTRFVVTQLDGSGHVHYEAR